MNIKLVHELYRMNEMVRYNTWQKINKETVASHSYFTSLFTMMLCDELKLPPTVKLEAIQIALVHDTPEIVINDITHDAKVAMPEINEILDRYENKFLQERFPEVKELMDRTDKWSEVAKTVVVMADIISVIQYCHNEFLLGNKPFQALLEISRLRLAKEKLKLEGLGIECQRIIV